MIKSTNIVSFSDTFVIFLGKIGLKTGKWSFKGRILVLNLLAYFKRNIIRPIYLLRSEFK